MVSLLLNNHWTFNFTSGSGINCTTYIKYCYIIYDTMYHITELKCGTHKFGTHFHVSKNIYGKKRTPKSVWKSTAYAVSCFTTECCTNINLRCLMKSPNDIFEKCIIKCKNLILFKLILYIFETIDRVPL